MAMTEQASPARLDSMPIIYRRGIRRISIGGDASCGDRAVRVDAYSGSRGLARRWPRRLDDRGEATQELNRRRRFLESS